MYGIWVFFLNFTMYMCLTYKNYFNIDYMYVHVFKIYFST